MTFNDRLKVLLIDSKSKHRENQYGVLLSGRDNSYAHDFGYGLESELDFLSNTSFVPLLIVRKGVIYPLNHAFGELKWLN